MNPFASDDDDKLVQILTKDNVAVSVDEDPLDSFMDQLDVEERNSSNELSKFQHVEVDEDEEETPEEMMDRILHEKSVGGSFDVAGYDEGPKRTIDNVLKIDHSKIDYPEFSKNLYNEHSSISELSSDKVAAMRMDMGISVTGSDIPKCVCSFGYLNLPDSVISVVRTMGYSVPTPVQCQTIPCALSGRDVLGIAPTGSGKTMSFLLPAMVHIMSGGSSRVLIVCPTRELAIQIEQEVYKFSKKCQFTSIALVGGLSKFEQFKEFKKSTCDVIVGNPGRILDILQMKKGIDLSTVTFCVLDEADRMFNMGFENQIRQIIQQIRPDRQMLMFSATMPPRIEKLAREILNNPVRIVVGSLGQAANEIDQQVFIAHSLEEKLLWLEVRLAAGGRTLIFVNSKNSAVNLAQLLGSKFGVGIIHGNVEQSDRMTVMRDFSNGKLNILVATDVAARGLDIASVSCVIEFEPAKDFDTHIHRIGRTGRAGNAGISYTLLSPDDSKLAAHIVESFEILHRTIPHDLLNLALSYYPFKLSRQTTNPKKIRTTDEEKTWEPLDSHFVHPPNAVQQDILPQDQTRIEETDNTAVYYAPGVHSNFGKLSKIHK